jgi:hypothetical protein
MASGDPSGEELRLAEQDSDQAQREDFKKLVAELEGKEQ